MKMINRIPTMLAIAAAMLTASATMFAMATPAAAASALSYGAIHIDTATETCYVAPGAESENITSCAYDALGEVTLTLAVTYSPAPTCVGAPSGSYVGVVNVIGRAPTSVVFTIHDLTGAPADDQFDFLCK
jgi:hypothetical protein